MKHFNKEYKDSKMNIEMWSFEERKQWLAFIEYLLHAKHC